MPDAIAQVIMMIEYQLEYFIPKICNNMYSKLCNKKIIKLFSSQAGIVSGDGRHLDILGSGQDQIRNLGR